MQGNHKFDLEERTLQFSKYLIKFLKILKRNDIDSILVKQLVRSGTSIGANYIEANDSLGKKDFVHRLRIARKEAKETVYWLKLIESSCNPKDVDRFIKEATELQKILSAIIKKSSA